MARIQIDEIENYTQSTGKNNFFNIPDHGKKAQVRFLANTASDLDIYFVHPLRDETGNTKFYNCLRTSKEDPIEKCPFCQAKLYGQAKVFVQLLDIETNEVKVWQRGVTEIDRLKSLSSRYAPLVTHVIEIERNGKKGDMKTSYLYYDISCDPNITLEQMPPKLDLSWLIIDKTPEEMAYYVQQAQLNGGKGFFPERTNMPATESRNIAVNPENNYNQPNIGSFPSNTGQIPQSNMYAAPQSPVMPQPIASPPLPQQFANPVTPRTEIF